LIYFSFNNSIKEIQSDFNNNKLTLYNILNKYSNLNIDDRISSIIKDISKNSKFLDINTNIQKPFFKLVYDKINNPIVFISKINNNNLTVYGVDGQGALSKNTTLENYMILNCTNRYFYNLTEINTIKINKYLRLGRGSLLLKYLENDLIIYFNNFNSNKIFKIKGSIGDIGDINISNEDRANFYKNNNYKIKGLTFYKNLYINNV
jgi:hypothetical protein